MDKAYIPEVHDAKWQRFWEEAEIGRPESSHPLHKKPIDESFCLMMPPPNVTGILHQGHALMLTLEDTLIRWERMKGKRTLYLPGTDHASIAVQMQVVKHLGAKGVDYKSLGREKFLDECWRWIEAYSPRIYAQIRALGVSCDWSRVKFTMDPELNEAVNHAFVELYKRGYIYRAQKLVNWCPKSLTVLSDLEVVFEERDAFLWHIQYPLKDDPTKHVVVATTRPETLLGDVAVAVHPGDERYKNLIGKMLVLPFTGREIPILSDDFVDPSFGSGAVKITPAHDYADFEVGLRHHLEFINVFTPDAKIVAGLPGEAATLAGLDRFEARKEMVAILKAKSQVREEAYKTRIGISERGGVPVEPYLSHQWFCKMDSMAANVSRDLEAGKIKFLPHEFHNQFMRWMEGIRDWCISRQLWWGHPIPAYHCSDCAHIEVAVSAPLTCPKCGSEQISPDSDVLDTWFSSGLWPFSTLGWPKKSEDLLRFYPTQVLETGFDILFFWVARMLMMGRELTGKIPFSRVYLHPIVRDEDGKKMSKSKGNTIDPLEIVQTAGADSLRMTLNALCVQGRDLRLSVERIETYRNFINKIWNATRFVLLDSSCQKIEATQGFDLPSKWIVTQLEDCAARVNKSWDNFRMQEAADAVYHFFWNDYCDWFIEISKTDRPRYQPVLLFVLSEALKLLHPLCPHASEELWHELPGVSNDESLALQSFPLGNFRSEAPEMRCLKDYVTALRTLRNENRVPLSKVITAVANFDSESKKLFEKNSPWLESLTKVKLKIGDKASGSTRALTFSSWRPGEALTVHVNALELIDLTTEREKIKKDLSQIETYIGSLRRKLKNDSFVAKAPKQVVAAEEAKLREAEEKYQKLNDNLKELSSLETQSK